MSRVRKILATLVVLGATGSLAAFGVFAAFSSTTTNPGNTITAGTVTITDNDAGVALYSLTNQAPAVTTTKCIGVTYTGSLDSTVKLYTADVLDAGAQYVNVVVTPGTVTAGTAFPLCTGFAAHATATPFTGTLQAFKTAHSSFANGYTVNPGAATKWVTNDLLAYRIAVSIADVGAAGGATSGTHAFTWEAQNQ